MGAGSPPLQQVTNKVLAITLVGRNRIPDKFPDKLPPVLSGLDKAEALAFVSQLYDHAKAGHSVWGDKLLLRKFIGQCSRTNSAETRNGYARELRHLSQWRDKNYPDLLLRHIDPYLMQQWVDDLRQRFDAGELKPNSYNRRISAVSAFYRWAAEPMCSRTTGHYVAANPEDSSSLRLG